MSLQHACFRNEGKHLHEQDDEVPIPCLTSRSALVHVIVMMRFLFCGLCSLVFFHFRFLRLPLAYLAGWPPRRLVVVADAHLGTVRIDLLHLEALPLLFCRRRHQSLTPHLPPPLFASSADS
jgi:hypothetical protein